MIHVSWDDAKSYVAWLSRKTGRTYRLLSESEWEYAARAGTTTPFSTGERITPEEANFDGNTPTTAAARVCIGRRQSRSAALRRTHSAFTTCTATYGSGWRIARMTATRVLPATALPGQPEGVTRRLLRGGSWLSSQGDVRAANRDGDAPDRRGDGIGFRVARTLTP